MSAIGVGPFNFTLSCQGVTLASSRGNLQNKTESLSELVTAWSASPCTPFHLEFHFIEVFLIWGQRSIAASPRGILGP